MSKLVGVERRGAGIGGQCSTGERAGRRGGGAGAEAGGGRGRAVTGGLVLD